VGRKDRRQRVTEALGFRRDVDRLLFDPDRRFTVVANATQVSPVTRSKKLRVWLSRHRGLKWMFMACLTLTLTVPSGVVIASIFAIYAEQSTQAATAPTSGPSPPVPAPTAMPSQPKARTPRPSSVPRQRSTRDKASPYSSSSASARPRAGKGRPEAPSAHRSATTPNVFPVHVRLDVGLQLVLAYQSVDAGADQSGAVVCTPDGDALFQCVLPANVTPGTHYRLTTHVLARTSILGLRDTTDGLFQAVVGTGSVTTPEVITVPPAQKAD
jgi:hypothetical protein